MTKNTIEKMKHMKMSGMVRAYQTSMETGELATLSADELIAFLVESEWDERHNRHIERRKKNARFRYQSSIEDLDYTANRNLSRTQITRFAECGFIEKNENILITGCTGIGKSYIASALGHQACIQGHKVLYANVAKLFSKLKMAKADGSYIKEIARIEKQDLLILDDFGLQPLDNTSRSALMEIVEDRHGKTSMIITSQVPVSHWYEVIGEKTIADAILDRIVHDAHRIELKGESLRRGRPKANKIEIIN